ncbi:MAG: hypothetical protein SFY56_11245 [Bacteroidota bacterium]|nr:hypothetical protein [Bacteroidota bacterium]
MFKGKKGLYILIPLNIAIWGFFIYRFYTAYNEVDEPVTTEKIGDFKIEELKDSVHYQLVLNYKDPFLKDVEKPKNNSNTNSNNNSASNNQNIAKVKIAVKTPTVAVIKPATDIKYLGLVKNNTTGQTTALVSINGKSHLVKKGDVVDGISVKNISNELIELMEGKNVLNISKN